MEPEAGAGFADGFGSGMVPGDAAARPAVRPSS